MATVNLVTTFLPLVDEKFTTESRKSLLTNNDFDWTGAHSIKVYKVSTSAMNDYDRPGANTAKNWSRFGPVAGLDATTEEMTLKKDRSFTFAIDKLDTDETAGQLQAAGALARQLREVVIPEVDAYTYGMMCAHPVATVAPTKLEDYRVHQDPPGISGDLVEGRICYDAFVLDNKKAAIYYQAVTA